jgi:hypothetical protein
MVMNTRIADAVEFARVATRKTTTTTMMIAGGVHTDTTTMTTTRTIGQTLVTALPSQV